MLPEYSAVIEWLPATSAPVGQEALPDVIATDEQPAILAPLSRKFTVPAGAPEEPEIVAVKVTLAPAVDGFEDELNAMDAFAFTSWARGDDALEFTVELPEYCAVMVWLPADKVLAEQVAFPDVSVTAEHPAIEDAPSRKSTVPLTLEALDTVAVNVTLLPTLDGLDEELSATVELAFTVCATAADVAGL